LRRQRSGDERSPPAGRERSSGQRSPRAKVRSCEANVRPATSPVRIQLGARANVRSGGERSPPAGQRSQKSFHTGSSHRPAPAPAAVVAAVAVAVAAAAVAVAVAVLTFVSNLPSGFKSGALTVRLCLLLKSSVVCLRCPRFAGERSCILGQRSAGRRTFAKFERTFGAGERWRGFEFRFGGLCTFAA